MVKMIVYIFVQISIYIAWHLAYYWEQEGNSM